jgi:hypothetical protein
MSIVRLPSFQAPEMRCFYEIQAVAALTTVKIVELLSEWGKRFSAGYAEASRSLLVFWIGLTPKDHSTAGNFRLGVITRDGDERLRSVLVVGATAVT